MRVKTNELTGAALDWAVAKAAGLTMGQIAIDGVKLGFYKPSRDWAQGGPIIEREWLEVVPWPNESDGNIRWRATQHDTPVTTSQTGPSPLIAAMRCYVVSKLGDEVEIPWELK